MVILDESIKLRIEKWTVPEPASGCHLWIGALANGYACLRINKKTTKVTRLIISASIGRDLKHTEHVLHSCDVKCCVNPAHLRIGNHKENMSDLWSRIAPKRKGEGIGRAKLTYKQIDEIRSSQESQTVLAKRYGVAKSTISFAKRGLTWSY